MMNLLQQIKNRRLALKLKQHDMPMRIGISRQQYQRLEKKGNPRLDTLELIAQGLNSEVLLIPKEKLTAVLTLLESDDTSVTSPYSSPQAKSAYSVEEKSFIKDPWKGLLGDEDDGTTTDNGS